jgi:DNA polymerase
MDEDKIKSIIDITIFAAECTQCELCKGRIKPVFARGNVNSRVIICGMCPGPDENQAGLPFVGVAGQILDLIIKEAFGTTPVYITNLVKCFVQPGKSLKDEWINACLPFFISQVGLIQPKALILLGKDVCSHFTKSKSSMGSLRGTTLSYMGATALMTYHPSFLARGGGESHPEYNTVVKDFKKALSFF